MLWDYSSYSPKDRDDVISTTKVTTGFLSPDRYESHLYSSNIASSIQWVSEFVYVTAWYLH